MAKILVIEDDALNREMITRRLAWEGYSTVTATNGLDGLAIIKAAQPDLVLMDVGLPIVDGWQVARHLKACEQTAHIPIIALTAFASLRDREQSLVAGCDDFETKPVNFQSLLAKILMLLSERMV